MAAFFGVVWSYRPPVVPDWGCGYGASHANGLLGAMPTTGSVKDRKEVAASEHRNTYTTKRIYECLYK